MMAPLTRSGLGSAQPSRALADLVLSGGLHPLVPSWLGAAWYAVGLAGCLVLALCAVESRRLLRIRAAAAVLGTATGAAVGCAVGGGPAQAGPAVWLVLAGLAGVLIATLLSVRGAVDRPAPRSREMEST
jgi:hypothetical protein